MKIRILGCGGSFGSPLAWMKNGNIDINNTKNFRTRSSVLITEDNTNILIENNSSSDGPGLFSFIPKSRFGINKKCGKNI